MELVLATRNPDKIREIKKVLGELSLKLLTFKDFPLFPYPQENAATLKENALIVFIKNPCKVIRCLAFFQPFTDKSREINMILSTSNIFSNTSTKYNSKKQSSNQ